MLSGPSTRTPSSSPRSPHSGPNFHSSGTSAVASGTPHASTPPATSSPLMATPTIGPSAPPASTSTSPTSLRGGCIIVDSTRKGKRFPDSMSKTIPIWACVLNRAIAKRLQDRGSRREYELESDTKPDENAEIRPALSSWDSSLHLPSWIPNTEKAAIGDRLEEWTRELEGCGADIDSVISVLRKPLRPLWISQKTLIWLNEVPEYDSWDFTPLILISASASNGTIQQRTTSEFSWQYIAGAGDDEESWARGLSPKLFWHHVFDIIDSGPDLCKKKVAAMVEKERVYHAHRSPQVVVKPLKLLGNNGSTPCKELQLMDSKTYMDSMSIRSSSAEYPLHWIGSTNVAVASTLHLANVSGHVDCILNCDSKLSSFSFQPDDMYMHLPIVTSKFNRVSIINNIPAAISFAKSKLSQGKKLLICCDNGEDISICVCLAILTYLFDEQDDDGKGLVMKERVEKRVDLDAPKVMMVHVPPLKSEAPSDSCARLEEVQPALRQGHCPPLTSDH